MAGLPQGSVAPALPIGAHVGYRPGRHQLDAGLRRPGRSRRGTRSFRPFATPPGALSGPRGQPVDGLALQARTARRPGRSSPNARRRAAVGLESLRQALQHASLCRLVEVDHHVAAEDGVEAPAQRPVRLQQVQLAEADHRAQFRTQAHQAVAGAAAAQDSGGAAGLGRAWPPRRSGTRPGARCSSTAVSMSVARIDTGGMACGAKASSAVIAML